MQEDNVLVAHGFLWWAERQDNSRPALAQRLVQNVELVEATLGFPWTLVISAFYHIDDMTVEVLWVTNGEFERLSLREEVMLLTLALLVDVGFLDLGAHARVGITWVHSIRLVRCLLLCWC